MAHQSPDSQLQSAFITRFPREVRDKIYLELWRSCGLHQHILYHSDMRDAARSHFCRWPCTTPFEVEDRLQESLDSKRLELGIELGKRFSNVEFAQKLRSPWINHFPCGQRINRLLGLKRTLGTNAKRGASECSTGGPCWINSRSNPESSSGWSPYMGMLLSCKIISSECIKSIYESTTFIFTDVTTLNLFVGFCKVPRLWQRDFQVAIPPPAFRTLGRHLELSLQPAFSTEFPCSSPTQTEERHSSLDFHGLRLDRLENLASLAIWISARNPAKFIDEDGTDRDQSPYNITKLSIESLKEVLAPLSHVKNITLSMPLADNTGPEDGYVVDSAHLKIWRRGPGDRFHIGLIPGLAEGHLQHAIYSSKDSQFAVYCFT
ncbi:hypothetical protein FPOAC1_010117 [Fusarium poae]|uniref:hypothetical protein n=1 Tax=Fusarium poae TaxID=36050 RepID=UPI001CE8BE9E|nr:hypothetical protein FPOAC1_010117 [Fusarium poae]KAG8670684.1 hypothetical protein FPOAC1_010117 [Fusarium poae]